MTIRLTVQGAAPEDGHGSSELFDTASSFLRVGPRFVVGSLWLVVEDSATRFTAEFYETWRRLKHPAAHSGQPCERRDCIAPLLFQAQRFLRITRSTGLRSWQSEGARPSHT